MLPSSASTRGARRPTCAPSTGRSRSSSTRRGRLELKTAPDVFGALAEAIVHQQLSTRVCTAIYARLCALFPRSGLTPAAVPRAGDAKLRGAGLSAAKIAAGRGNPSVAGVAAEAGPLSAEEWTQTTGMLMGALSDLHAARARMLIEGAGQTVEYRSFPQMGHAMHQQDPKLFAATLVEWAAKLS